MVPASVREEAEGSSEGSDGPEKRTIPTEPMDTQWVARGGWGEI